MGSIQVCFQHFLGQTVTPQFLKGIKPGVNNHSYEITVFGPKA